MSDPAKYLGDGQPGSQIFAECRKVPVVELGEGLAVARNAIDLKSRPAHSVIQ